MSNNTVILAKNLTKSFGNIKVVDGINFAIESSGCVGLLGPNGAGKSTTMRMIMGLSSVSSGSLEIFGEPISLLSRSTKARIGAVPQDNNLDPDITVRENLEVFGRYFSLSNQTIAARTPKILKFMNLLEKESFAVNTLSGGMKRRLIIGRALINDPSLIILDEPTAGLDPQARLLIWRRLSELKKNGQTLLLSTHYMDEAERLCDRIIIIDQGKILDNGTPEELIKRHVGTEVFEIKKPHCLLIDEAGWVHEDIGDTVLYYVKNSFKFSKNLPDNIKYIHRRTNLEDVFFRLTGRQLRES